MCNSFESLNLLTNNWTTTKNLKDRKSRHARLEARDQRQRFVGRDTDSNPFATAPQKRRIAFLMRSFSKLGKMLVGIVPRAGKTCGVNTHMIASG